ncbi:MAG: hypothetical protein V1778_05485 [bacterium]
MDSFVHHPQHESETRRKRPRVATTLLNLLLPPVAGKFHGRYRGRSWSLFLDTILALILLFLLGSNIILWTKSTTLAPPEPTFTLSGPSTAKQGDLITVTATIENVEQPLGATTMTLDLPAGFLLADSSPQPDAAQGTTWTFTSVEQQTSVTLHGRITGTPAGDVRFAGWLATHADTVALTLRQSWQTTVVGSIISATFDAPKTAASNQPLTLTLTLANSTQGATPALTAVIDLPKGFVVADGGSSASPSRVTRNVPAVGAGESERITLTGVFSANAVADMRFAAHVGFTDSADIATAETIIRVSPAQSASEIAAGTGSAGIAFAAEAHYFSTSGIQFGYGPLPPRIGATTGYRVFWIIRSNTTDLNNLSIVAPLSLESAWGGHATVALGSTISYDAKERTIRWDVGTLRPDDGAVSGSFEVTVTPHTQKTSYALLLDSWASGVDASTGKNIRVSSPAVSTVVE